MATDKFSFYAGHYSDILQLMNLNNEVQEQFPIKLGSLIEDVFKDALLRNFAGVPKWDYENQVSSYDCFCFWDPELCPAGDYGPYFAIHPLSKAAEIVDVSSIKSLVHCEVLFEHPERNRLPIRHKNLVAATLKSRKSLETAGLMVSADMKNDPYVRLDVSDLLHISVFKKRQRNLNHLVKRAEKFVTTFIPILERAARM